VASTDLSSSIGRSSVLGSLASVGGLVEIDVPISEGCGELHPESSRVSRIGGSTRDGGIRSKSGSPCGTDERVEQALHCRMSVQKELRVPLYADAEGALRRFDSLDDTILGQCGDDKAVT
jgi:hypothetical protein